MSLRLRRRTDPDPRLLAAEQHVADLKRRADSIVTILRERHDRNHWAETIERLYKGGRA